MASLRYTHAIVCRIPNSLKTEDFDLEEAKRQHEEYCHTLRNLGVDVIELPPDENLPNCVFVEDTAIVCNGTALICRLNHPSRRKEVDIVRTIIRKELELPVVEIADAKATIEGGDVLFTGREFFVGLSSYTNEAGARALAAAFPEFPVTPVKVSGEWRLKSFMSVAGPDIICVSAGQEAQGILKRIAREATFRYQTVTVPDDEASNCLFVNGTLIHPAEFPESTKVFEGKIDFSHMTLRTSELSKVGGALTRCSILIKKSKYIKKL
ncbi:N(G),N(G)-dimethylarginine dimethylaminohydrolase 1 [Centruroides vittatus]|uniref:N(G),N(G)-dimethylarginine dimethylaminohydrolase 1-like n=1 Tax=Centruroides sculpturatus TaxID=218467 RepID=UPI000C6CE401|nr:N(G),N(G)-dimethylarginine dimethylaminohydrolase 1-like [Centruroides sculpturatus]